MNEKDNQGTRVFIIDEQPIVRHGLSQLINHESPFIVCGEADTAHKALESIEILQPDLVTLDSILRGADTIDMIKTLRDRHPRLIILIISSHEESLYAERTLRAGAHGYIMKSEPLNKILAAIHRVLSQEIYVSEGLSEKILHRLVHRHSSHSSKGNASSIETLSDRELQVFQLISRGRGTREIAKDLFLSIKTVETHCAHIKEKLKLRNSMELVQYAFEWHHSLISSRASSM